MSVVLRKGLGHFRVIALAGAGAACLALAACSSSGGDPLAHLSGKQIVTEAVGNLKNAASFTMKGTVQQSGSDVTFNLGYKNGSGCEGTVGEGGKGSLAIVVIGTTAYIKLDDAFIKSVAGSQASAALAVLSGKYVTGSTSNSNVSSITSVCDVNSLTSAFTKPTDISKGKITTLDGKQVVPLTDKVKGGTAYVTDTSHPELVEIKNSTGKGGSTGVIKFDVGAPVKLTVPPSSQVINGSSFGFLG